MFKQALSGCRHIVSGFDITANGIYILGSVFRVVRKQLYNAWMHHVRGATGFFGSKVLEEALARGHQVTAICRDPSKITVKAQNLILSQRMCTTTKV